MGKNDRLSRDQKRKIKLKKRDDRSRKPESLAYHGRKYRTTEFVPVLKDTEIGIYEAYVMYERTLTDDEVETALVEIIGHLRDRESPLLPPPGSLTVSAEGRHPLVIELIQIRWRYLQEKGELPGREDLIGILRTILSSLETWRAKSLHSQGYLRFLEGFMKDIGVNVRLEKNPSRSLKGLEG